MKLSQWAKKNGLCYKTAWNLATTGKLPGVRRLETGTILIDEDVVKEARCAIYSRVSSHDQKADLSRQTERLQAFCLAAKLPVVKMESEIGSGLNGSRKKLLKLLRDATITTLVVEHRDRLARFGVEFVEACLKASGRQLIVVEQADYKDDLVQDFVDLATSMCAKIYGKRSAKNRAKRMLEVATKYED